MEENVRYSRFRAVSNAGINLDHDMSRGLIDPDEVDAHFPLVASTGYRRGDTARLMDRELSSFEKERIIQRMHADKGSYLPSDFTDAELFNLAPPRLVLRDPVDVQWFRDVIGDYVSKEMADKLDLSEDPQPVDHASESDDPTE